jgi:hypothetical protein
MKRIPLMKIKVPSLTGKKGNTTKSKSPIFQKRIMTVRNSIKTTKEEIRTTPKKNKMVRKNTHRRMHNKTSPRKQKYKPAKSSLI